MNAVTILPVVAEDGQLIWRTPHWKMPFLRPNTFYEFKAVQPKGLIPFRIVSAWINYPEPPQ